MGRVTGSGQHDAERDPPVPPQLDLVQAAICGMQQHVDEVALEPHQDGLGLGVTHPGVELERLGSALGIDHQARIEKACEHDAVARHALHGGQDDFLHGLGMHVGRDHRRRRISTHAAGVGPQVTVQQAFVVLAGRQRQHVLAVHQHDEAGLLALQKLFDHNPGHGLPI